MDKENSETGNAGSEMVETFQGILMYDVILAFEKLAQDQSQSAKRNLVRTIFTGIEGLVWIYREYVRSMAQNLDNITPIMDLAFSETTYSISETGKLETQTRHASLTAMFRYTTRVAEQLSPRLKVDFGNEGWSDLKSAIATRNRITHPKSIADLEITADELATIIASFDWLTNEITNIMEATLGSAKRHLHEVKIILKNLQNGDVLTMAEYQEARERMLREI